MSPVMAALRPFRLPPKWRRNVTRSRLANSSCRSQFLVMSGEQFFAHHIRKSLRCLGEVVVAVDLLRSAFYIDTDTPLRPVTDVGMVCTRHRPEIDFDQQTTELGNFRWRYPKLSLPPIIMAGRENVARVTACIDAEDVEPVHPAADTHRKDEIVAVQQVMVADRAFGPFGTRKRKARVTRCDPSLIRYRCRLLQKGPEERAADRQHQKQKK